MQKNDRLLIELNQLLTRIKHGHINAVDQNYPESSRVQQNVIGGQYNNENNDSSIIVDPADPAGATGPTGASGPTGATGPTGPTGECSCTCNAIVVANNYTATIDDYYIGVNSSKPVTVTLPTNIDDCKQVIIKAEIGPPLGNRKVTITTSDGSTIDGATQYVMSIPYESVQLLYRGGNWHII